jgi:hypothetical protein
MRAQRVGVDAPPQRAVARAADEQPLLLHDHSRRAVP